MKNKGISLIVLVITIIIMIIIASAIILTLNQSNIVDKAEKGKDDYLIYTESSLIKLSLINWNYEKKETEILVFLILKKFRQAIQCFR